MSLLVTITIIICLGFPGISAVKNPSAMQETWLWFLDREDPPSGKHGNPPQYPWLENSIDRGAWRATVPGVTTSWTRLKWLSLHALFAYK